MVNVIMKISSLKKGSNFSINIKNIKLDKKLLVAIIFLVLSILGGGAYLYYENEKTKKLEQARLQKIQK
ncbi:TPA: pilus assembly protein, partial [Vibrio cholerae O1]|nr:pilus assembly protein [Vibrio cholerae]